jgi:TolB-like protein/class 3 adenylate cyclase/Flp pilus assembly protein TadD
MTTGTERKLAAIMFTDMVGFSALTQRNEALALELLAEHQRLLRPVFVEHGGHEIKAIGDGFLVDFASALQAVRCAIAIQTAMVQRNASEAADRRILLRIGLHLGDVEVRDGDVFGDGVNIASRIEPLAEAGGICITGPMFDQVRNKIDEALVQLAKPELKNIQVPIDVYRVVLPWTAAVSKRNGTRLGAIVAAGGAVAALLVWWATSRAPQVPSAPPAAGVPPSESTPTATLSKKSVAVLPFVNMSSDKENEYFSDGITEDLIAALSKVSGLHVAARTSSFAFKGKNEDIRTIGAQLGVGSVLEGSVAKSGNRVRITAQLINTADGYHLWSESYDRDLQDIFGIRSEVAQTVAKALQVTLGTAERQRLEQKPTKDVEAYQLYLKARHATATLDDWATAMRYLQQAIARDPNYALAYQGLAEYYVWSADWVLPSRESMPRAREAAKKALALDPSLAEPHVWLATAHWWYDQDVDATLREFETALAMEPDLVTANQWYGLVLVDLGRFDEGIASTRRAYELDPLAPNVATFMGMNLFFAGRNDAAIVQLRTATTAQNDNWFASSWLARAYARAGRYPEAIAAARKAHELAPQYAEAESNLGRTYADAGEKAEAEKVLDHLRERVRIEIVAPPYFATILIGLGRFDEALVELAKAAEERSWYVMNWKVDPDLDPLRGDPRFQALLEKVGLGL